MTKRFTSVLALLTLVAIIGSACSSSQQADSQPDDQVAAKGGVLDVETDGIGFTAGFDPTGEYLGLTFSLMGNLMGRTLVTYRHTQGEAGNEVVPDLATALPEVSADGMTYTFTLKDGIKFGPPLSREITSSDIEFAFRRINTSGLAQYPSYFRVIEGMEEEVKELPDSISGIETPDDKTIVFHLIEKTPDFPYRLALPAAQAMPEEVAGCFDKSGEYGRYYVSSGPYMIEGSDELDAASCSSLKPLSGFNPDTHLYFVRNPDYEPSTDSTEIRENNVDEIRIDVNTNSKDIYNKIEAGEIDAAVSSGNPPPDVLRRYSTDANLEDNLKIGSDDRTWYLTMNLTTAPFDDIHVRKAANLVMDKESLRQAWGGEISGRVATHIMPPEMTGGTPTAEEYDPYPHDVEAAKEEMALSRYDSDGDGMCDHDACKDVIVINRNLSPWTEMEPVVQQSLAEIGIDIQVRPLDPSSAYTTIQTVNKQIQLGMNPGWGKDYPDPYTFIGFLFASSGIACEGNYNYALVGFNKEIAGECGVPYVEGVPNVDADIERCLDAPAGDTRNTCWIDLDKKLMEEVVPWVPYLWPTVITTVSDSVTAWDYDQFAASTAWSKLAVED